MTIYVYADAVTKEIVTVSENYLAGMDSFVEIPVADDHPIVSSSEGTARYVLNAANTDIEVVNVTHKDSRLGREDRRTTVDLVFSTVLTFIQKALIATHNEAQVLELWQDFNYGVSRERVEFVETGYRKLLTDIAVSIPAHDAWLDLDFGGITVREYIQTKLAVSGV